MSDRVLETGKLPAALLRELLDTAPPLPAEVLLGPRVGEDACAISVPAGTLVAATDPITLTGADVGAHAVVINANDVAVMGVRPRWFLAVLLLPEGTRESEVRALFSATERVLRELGAVLVGGHSEVTAAVRQPIVVGQMLGLTEDAAFVTTGGAAPGDVVLQVGAVPVEGAAVLAQELAGQLETLDRSLLALARDAMQDPGISVVEAALRSAELGATALHDPTEGGLATGLQELAEASGVSLRLNPAEVVWFEPGVAVCRLLGADPWGTLASGALLAAFPPDRVDAACRSLREAGHPVGIIAEAGPGAGVAYPDDSALARFERDEVARILAERS